MSITLTQLGPSAQTEAPNCVITEKWSIQTSKAYRYIVVAAASANLFVGVGYTNTFGVFQEYYQTSILKDEAPEKIIVIGAIAASLYLSLGAFTGRFADVVGYRISLLIGAGLMTGAMFAASVSKTYNQLLMSQGIMFGLGVAFTYLPSVSVSKQYWDQNYGVANGIVVSGGALGGCILPYIVRLMADRLGLAQAFRILGYVAAGILVPSSFLIQPKNTSWSSSSFSANRSRRRSRPTTFQPSSLMDFSLLKDSRFLFLVTACSIAMIGFLPRYFLIPPSAVAQGIGPTYASWLLGMMNGLSIVGRIGIGWFADRYGKVTALTISFILCGLGHFLFWLPGVLIPGAKGSTALFTLFVVYIGLLGSGFISLFPVVISHLFGSDALASKNGLLNSSVGLATLAGPSAVYAIVGSGSGNNWWEGILTAGLFMVIGGLILWSQLVRAFKPVASRSNEN